MKHNDAINENGYYVKTINTRYLLRIRNGINGNNVQPNPPSEKLIEIINLLSLEKTEKETGRARTYAHNF